MTAWAPGPVTWPTMARPVAVVLGVVGSIDGGLRVRGGLGEADVGFDAAGADLARAAGQRVAVPGTVRATGRSDIQLALGADDPHRRERPQRPVSAAGGEAQLVSVADAGELAGGPGHNPVLASVCVCIMSPPGSKT